ncbi:class 1 fructose-bisphosphatase [Sinirhodobacter populi]|uniref:Fructose-1,6-bisphosphatase class 1 n=1 Tax=Paenirhodobacter populi TaxID=2306993 RepID=A0A443K2A1_9RHOB|nr:class 1 fructose-bisphosphatase [Sinirhodobacter populi]RWR26875.1 class 1 fructose-bisphosphatase [Sinirhodobacter populi]
MSLDLDGLTLSPELADLMQRLTDTATTLQRIIARNGITEDLSAAQGVNAGGDGQKALDVIADEAFKDALKDSAVLYYASEEDDDYITFDGGNLALAIDPLDGSSNIDVNVTIGTIFSVFPAAATPEASFLRKGREQIAGGFIIYGPQMALIASFGDGVHKWVFDPDTGRFERLADLGKIPAGKAEFAINASNARHWPAPVKAYIDDLLAGETGPRGKNYNARWVASLVAETYRILHRGGVFLYPGDGREGYARGRLRHLYECAPIAMLIEQAGGAATDGVNPILDEVPTKLHERTPLVFGPVAEVKRVALYFTDPARAAQAADDQL